VVGQADQVIGDLGILGRALRLVAVAGFADPERRTHHAYARAALLHGLMGHLAPARWLHHFFSRASFTISAFSRSSAYIFFSRAFSPSGSLGRAMSDASMPPNLARHL